MPRPAETAIPPLPPARPTTPTTTSPATSDLSGRPEDLGAHPGSNLLGYLVGGTEIGLRNDSTDHDDVVAANNGTKLIGGQISHRCSLQVELLLVLVLHWIVLGLAFRSTASPWSSLHAVRQRSFVSHPTGTVRASPALDLWRLRG